MEKTLTITNRNQEIGFSDLDGENELKISTIDIDDRETVVWLSSENVISLKEHLDYLASKILD